MAEPQISKREIFQQVTRRMCGSLDISKSLSDCYSYLKDFIPMESMMVFWFEERQRLLRIIADQDNESGFIKNKLMKVPDAGLEYLETVKSIRHAMILNDFNANEATKILAELCGKEGRSGIAMTLTIGDNPIGRIVVSCRNINTYNDYHAEMMTFLHDPFAIAVANYQKHEELIRLKDTLSDDKQYLIQSIQKLAGAEVIGSEFGLNHVIRLVRQVAMHNIPVMLNGETGVGKEVIANTLHNSSGRKDGPFIKVNCGAIPDSLLDSELFGHEKGAFTGAIDQKKGRFERATGGTIFLDEIGELPLKAQVRLLRVIQYKELERIGGREKIPVDIRIISATHKNLKQMVKEGSFREDLYFRLNVFPIDIPPLRERTIDIPDLLRFFLETKSQELNIPEPPEVSAELLEALMNYTWKGNVRELENAVERALIQYNGSLLTIDSFFITPFDKKRLREPVSAQNSLLSIENVTIKYIESALQEANGKINGFGGAAELLDINPNTLRNKMDKLGIAYGQKTKAS